MTKFEKLVENFRLNPTVIKYKDIEKILLTFGFEKKEGKGSHIKFSFHESFLVFSLHNGEVKNYQKTQTLSLLRSLSLLS